MDSETLVIIICVALVVFILLLRFLLNAAANKGAQAISNAVARSRNEKNGAQRVMLRDLYPELAARVLAESVHLGGVQPIRSDPPLSAQSVPAPPQEPAKPKEWMCPGCGGVNTGSFCQLCGMQRPEIFR